MYSLSIPLRHFLFLFFTYTGAAPHFFIYFIYFYSFFFTLLVFAAFCYKLQIKPNKSIDKLHFVRPCSLLMCRYSLSTNYILMQKILMTPLQIGHLISMCASPVLSISNKRLFKQHGHATRTHASCIFTPPNFRGLSHMVNGILFSFMKLSYRYPVLSARHLLL